MKSMNLVSVRVHWRACMYGINGLEPDTNAVMLKWWDCDCQKNGCIDSPLLFVFVAIFENGTCSLESTHLSKIVPSLCQNVCNSIRRIEDVCMDFEQITVECYSGYKVNERPVAFTCRGRHRRITEIIDQWYEGGVEPDRPASDYFKVRTEEGDIFLLRYNSLFDAWSLFHQTSK